MPVVAAASSKPVLYRIGKSTDLFASVYFGDGERFTQSFRQVLAGLPRPVFQLIFTYWSPITLSSPVIRVEPGLILSCNSLNKGIGTSENSGYMLRFAGPAVESAPDKILRSLIVHELAHDHQMAGWKLGLLSREEFAAYSEAVHDQNQLVEQLESFADLRTRSWGCDSAALRRWTEEFLSAAG